MGEARGWCGGADYAAKEPRMQGEQKKKNTYAEEGEGKEGTRSLPLGPSLNYSTSARTHVTARRRVGWVCVVPLIDKKGGEEGGVSEGAEACTIRTSEARFDPSQRPDTRSSSSAGQTAIMRHPRSAATRRRSLTSFAVSSA